MKYIITPELTMVKTDEKIICKLTPNQISEYEAKGYTCKERIYNLTIENHEYEIVCTEIWKKGDNEHSVMIPSTSLPHRPYLLEVYLYAINLYSSRPEMSQRAAAEATRKEFKLVTFSHTTLGRAMKALLGTLAQSNPIINEQVNSTAGIITETRIEMEIESTEATEIETVEPITGEKECKSRIQRAKSMQRRRKLLKAFFKNKFKKYVGEKFIQACKRIAERWNARFKKLLI